MAKTTAQPLDYLQSFMPMVMVKNGLRAAVTPECAYLMDRVTKVEFTMTRDERTYKDLLNLRIWWELEEGEEHVSTRQTTIDVGTTMDPLKVLEELTTFEPEDVLKYAAFV